MRVTLIIVKLVFVLLLLFAQGGTAAVAAPSKTNGQTVYVPV